MKQHKQSKKNEEKKANNSKQKNYQSPKIEELPINMTVWGGCNSASA